jgi:Zn-dependent protease with chaperone function
VLALLAFGVSLLITATIAGKVLGVVLLLLAIELRPRFPSPLRARRTVERHEAPKLFALVDEVAAAIGCRQRIDVIALGDDLNASCGIYGIRRRAILAIGLPLWAALDASSRIALLGHELGHLTNGDPNRSLITQPAVTTFARLAAITDPRLLVNPTGVQRNANWLGHLAGRILLTPICSLMRWAQIGVWSIAARDHQRAELVADGCAAEVAGSVALVELCRVLLASGAVRGSVVRSASRGQPAATWPSAVRAVLEERRKSESYEEQLSLRTEASAFASHPPAGMRLRLARGWEQQAGVLDAASIDFAAIDEDLGDEMRRTARSLART